MVDKPTGVACDPLDLYPLDPGPELEKLAVFAACVPGNRAAHIWPKVKAMLARIGRGHDRPFAALAGMTAYGIRAALTEARIGRYAQVTDRLWALAKLPPAWQPDHLVGLPGINHKTARMVRLYSTAYGDCACLDRHVLRPMAAWPVVRKLGIKVPASSPQDADAYAVLETVFLREAARRRLAPWELDREMWRRAAGLESPRG